jgi:hypothetical protein
MTALRSFLGLDLASASHLEKWLSVSGGLAGLLAVTWISREQLGLSASASLVASMGASAVLLFAVPHGALSQPWPVLGGHVVSATVGVVCAKLIGQPATAAAAAVALAIGAMHYLRCIHPPGGATALTAVAGGDAVQSLGFQYIVTPVLLNVLIIVLVAILFNLPFPWRRYPAAWARRKEPMGDSNGAETFTRRDLSAVVSVLSGSVKVSEQDLDTLCSLARCDTADVGIRPQDIRVGAYYCNGAFGAHWQVRRVVHCAGSRADDMLSYAVVAGAERRRSGASTREAFSRWARYEVSPQETGWRRVEAPDGPSDKGIAEPTHPERRYA